MKDKPNEWVSIADLMAGVVAVVMLLFVIAALQVARYGNAQESARVVRQQEIESVMVKIARVENESANVTIRDNIVDFGAAGKFLKNSSKLEPENADDLRAMVAKMIPIVQQELGQKWIKQFVVIGYADGTGDYLYNLNLSLERSQRVLCELVSPQPGSKVRLSDEDRDVVRNMFLASGYSFNSLKATNEDSRRVEVRLEFWQIDEARPPAKPSVPWEPGQCGIR